MPRPGNAANSRLKAAADSVASVTWANQFASLTILLLLLLLLILINQSIVVQSKSISIGGRLSRMRYKNKLDYQAYSALVGNSIALPCNITPPTVDDGVSLILWYRDDLSSPIYTVDARLMSHLSAGKHFLDTSILANRVTFNITYPVSYLRFDPAVESDTAEYRCRVDFRRGRTINRVMQLNIIVPTKRISIYDGNNNYINDIAGPFNEDSALNITCDSEGGNPLPSVKWWKGDSLLNNHSFSPSKNIIRNVITFSRLLREHLMMPLTCEATNTNLTVPVTKTILIDLNLKPVEVKIIEPLQNMTAGQRVQLVCQSSGSRPPAKIRWKKNNNPLEHYSESTSDDGTVTTNFLTFVPAVEDHGTPLTCIAFNPQFADFRIESTLQLSIHYEPILSLLLGASVQRQEIVEGSTVYFDCNIQANPQVNNFGWLLNGNELMNKNQTDSEMEIRNNSIIIRSVNRAHIGSYQCYAANPLGKSVSEIVNLHVKYMPTCVGEEQHWYELQLFEEITIQCNVAAEPKKVMFYWEFNSTDSVESDDTEPLEEPMMTITNGESSSVLKFTPRSIHDYGTLYCFAQNRIGRQSKPCVFHIVQSALPEAPSNCSLENITEASLTVHCYFNNTEAHQFVLLIYNDSNQLIRNVTKEDYPHFIVHHLPQGFNFKLFVYSTSRSGQSEKVQIVASTLVGEPRKLEHIEQKMPIKPPLIWILLIICLLLFAVLALFVIFKMRQHYKGKQRKGPKSAFDTGNPGVSGNSPAECDLNAAYSVQIKSLNEQPASIIAEEGEAPCSIDSGPMLNQLPSTEGELRNMSGTQPQQQQPYLELTNLSHWSQAKNLDFPSPPPPLPYTEHVSLCSNLMPGDLLYLHDPNQHNAFVSDCLLKEASGIGSAEAGAGTELSLSEPEFVPTLSCIFLNQPTIGHVATVTEGGDTGTTKSKVRFCE